MDQYQRIAGHFQQAIELIAMSVDVLAEPIERSSELISQALLQENKVIVCGNGPDHALSQLFASNLINRFEYDRPGLPALSLGQSGSNLSATSDTSNINDIFARQITALGQAGDVLFCISSECNHQSLQYAIQAAQERNMMIVALSNSSNQQLGNMLRHKDVELIVTAQRQPHVVEVQTMVIQCICELIELSLFGDYDQE
ncbi:MAG: phosphoheptose isomerase [Halioglobus sp.]|jgi:phosphoheptose isomerase